MSDSNNIDTALANKIVDFLNSLLELDPQAIRDLIESRVECNDALADHPTVRVNVDTCVGMLGILNGLCGTDPLGGVIVAAFADDECKRLNKFYVRNQFPGTLSSN